jgi:hypothetical protein
VLLRRELFELSTTATDADADVIKALPGKKEAV